MAVIIDVQEFLNQTCNGTKVILDTRSPAEFSRAHLPNAISLPLLSNEERVIIGTTYKQEGREAAVLKGFELVGPKFADFVKQAKILSPANEVFIYCWRGGLRSNIMAWVLTTAGFKVTLLKGGYKAFRHWALAQFEIKKTMVVIGGKTGSGKTALLHQLKNSGEQIIDLEALANHNGSTFGSLGKPEQPTTEHYENMLALLWHGIDSRKVWVENESFKIGTCALPMAFYKQLREAPVMEINIADEIRKKRIVNEYGHFDKKLLAEKTMKIKKRLGGLQLKNALSFLEEGNINAWCEVMLEYYDKAYLHSDALRNQSKKKSVFFEHDQMALNVQQVIKECLHITNIYTDI
jgi:tRNA 2-selenouridine synthase